MPSVQSTSRTRVSCASSPAAASRCASARCEGALRLGARRLELLEAGQALLAQPGGRIAGRLVEQLARGGEDRPGLLAPGVAAAAARGGQEDDRPAEHAELDADGRASGGSGEDARELREAGRRVVEVRAVEHVAADGVDITREGVPMIGDGGLHALAPADQAGVPGQPRGGGQEEVAIEAGEARDLRDHRLRVREDDDERAALQRAHQLVAAPLQDLPRRDARPRERVDHSRVAVRGVLLRGVEELADAAEHALRIDRDRLVVEAGGRVEDRVVIDRDVGQGASDGEQAHGSAPSPEASRSSMRSA